MSIVKKYGQRYGGERESETELCMVNGTFAKSILTI